MLTIEHLTKSYGGAVKAVDDLSLTVLPGDIYGFIGHNGAGKTTTLRATAGILAFDSGEIRIDGKSIAEQPIACKREMASRITVLLTPCSHIKPDSGGSLSPGAYSRCSILRLRSSIT